MSAVRTMWSLSLFNSLKARFCALVRLGFGGWEDVRTLLTSALSSSASCWLKLVQAASMAVIYSKLGGCLRLTTKLGPLARTDLCGGVKGLLDRLMTHLGLGSSGEDPWGSLLWVWGVGLLSWVPALSAWGGSAVTLGSLEGPLPSWMPAWPGTLIAWLTCLGRVFPSRGKVNTCLGGWGSHWTASFLRGKGSYQPACCLGGLGNLTACWQTASFPGGRWGPAWLPAWDELLASLEGRWAPAWEVTAWLPAWDTILPSPRGRGYLPDCLPEISSFLPQGEGECLPDCLPEIHCFLPRREGEHQPGK